MFFHLEKYSSCRDCLNTSFVIRSRHLALAPNLTKLDAHNLESNPWNLAFSVLCLVSSFEAFWKCWAKAGKECQTADNALKDEATQRTVNTFPILLRVRCKSWAQLLSSRMFLGDWLYKEYKHSRKDCKSFVPLVAFSALPTASSSLWLRQCHNTISGNSSLSNFPTPDFVPNITLAPSLQNPMKTSCSNSVVNPFFRKQSKIASLICEAHRVSKSTKSSGKLLGARLPLKVRRGSDVAAQWLLHATR